MVKIHGHEVTAADYSFVSRLRRFGSYAVHVVVDGVSSRVASMH